MVTFDGVDFRFNSRAVRLVTLLDTPPVSTRRVWCVSAISTSIPGGPPAIGRIGTEVTIIKGPHSAAKAGSAIMLASMVNRPSDLPISRMCPSTEEDEVQLYGGFSGYRNRELSAGKSLDVAVIRIGQQKSVSGHNAIAVLPCCRRDDPICGITRWGTGEK